MLGLLRRLKFISRRESVGHTGLDPETEQTVLARAYVPEHIPGLMTRVSDSQPFLIEEYLGFVKDNWLILVGYPLEGDFTPERAGQIVEQAVETYRPEYLWFIGPETPPSLLDRCRTRQSDVYYQLDLAQTRPKSSLRRVARKAAERLAIERGRSFGPEHQALTAKFRQRQSLPPLIEALYEAMPAYVAGSETACVLEARDESGSLNAFYVVELAAQKFDTYVLGCYSRQPYVPHASDLLFWEMIDMAQARGKSLINLGLGVNEGISRFKKKWGGAPYLAYEFCECYYGRSPTLAVLDDLLAGSR
jgi:hypothetical protein